MRKSTEVAYLGYNIEKVYKVLVAELPKRGYTLSSRNHEKFELTLTKKKWFRGEFVISIKLSTSKTGSTQVLANSTMTRQHHKPSGQEIIIDEVLKIF